MRAGVIVGRGTTEGPAAPLHRTIDHHLCVQLPHSRANGRLSSSSWRVGISCRVLANASRTDKPGRGQVVVYAARWGRAGGCAEVWRVFGKPTTHPCMRTHTLPYMCCGAGNSVLWAAPRPQARSSSSTRSLRGITALPATPTHTAARPPWHRAGRSSVLVAASMPAMVRASHLASGRQARHAYSQDVRQLRPTCRPPTYFCEVCARTLSGDPSLRLGSWHINPLSDRLLAHGGGRMPEVVCAPSYMYAQSRGQPPTPPRPCRCGPASIRNGWQSD